MDTNHHRPHDQNSTRRRTSIGRKQDRPNEAPKPKNAPQEQEGERNPEHRNSGKEKTLRQETYRAADRLSRHAEKLPALYELFQISPAERQRRNEMVAKESTHRGCRIRRLNIFQDIIGISRKPFIQYFQDGRQGVVRRVARRAPWPRPSWKS